MAQSTTSRAVPYGGYYQRDVPAEDVELTHVGPGTPAGEYLRRFWQPVGLSRELQDLPVAVRVMGEDLVLFRNGEGQVGLLHAHCSHRGTSLEFGTVERQGLRCCYHGWLYGVDGRVLDTPGEAAESTYKDRLCQGAYPTLEHKGLVFAYMGPPDQQPEFPIFDAFDMPGYRTIAERQTVTPCNWLQLAENNMDPVHLVYLHRFEEIRKTLNEFRPSADAGHTYEDYVRDGLAQWEADVDMLREETRQQSVFEWQETPCGMLWAWTRRIGDLVWVRVSDFIPPNIDQIPRTLPVAYESDELLFDPPRTTTWTVPIDDTSTLGYGFQYRPVDAAMPSRFQFTGTSIEGRSYAERQQVPGDFEALVTQRPIAVHRLEHLAWSDTGVMTVRKFVREGVRAVQRGESPVRQMPGRDGAIPTYARSTILRVPAAPTPEADRDLLRATARRVIAGEFPKPTAAAVR